MKFKDTVLGRRAVTKLDSILKSLDVTLLRKVHKVKAMLFPGVTYGSESWTITKAWGWRMWRFQNAGEDSTVPWTTRRANQSVQKEINPEYSLEGLMLKLKLQYFSHLKSWLIGKDPDAGKDWRQEEKGTTEDKMVGWHHWLNGHEFEQAPGGGEGQGSLVCCSPWGRKKLDTT